MLPTLTAAANSNSSTVMSEFVEQKNVGIFMDSLFECLWMAGAAAGHCAVCSWLAAACLYRNTNMQGLILLTILARRFQEYDKNDIYKFKQNHNRVVSVSLQHVFFDWSCLAEEVQIIIQ